MVRLSTTTIKERLYAARNRTTPLPPPPQEQETVSPTPVQRVEAGDLSPSELRQLGSALQLKEGFLARQKEKIAFLESRIKERESEGKDAGGTKARLAALQESYRAELSEYYAMRENLTGETYSKAQAAAPKRYREERLRERTYDPSGDLAEEQVAMKQRRSFVQARELASRQPGIYQYRSGGAFISQAGEGSYINYRGEQITIRSPVASRVGGGFIYASTPSSPPTGRVVQGFDLFNPETRAALTTAVASGEYKTVGGLYAAAAAPQELTWFGRASAAYGRGRARVDALVSSPNQYLRVGTVPQRSLQLVSSDVYNASERLRSRGGSADTIFERGSNFLMGFTSQFRERPVSRPIELTGEGALWYGGGRLITWGVSKVAPRLAARYGAQTTIIGLERSRKAAGLLLGSAVVYDVSTSSAAELGEKTPGYLAGGLGLGLGLAAGPRLTPRTIIEPPKYVRGSKGVKIGQTPGDFAVNIKTPVTITETAYGFSRTIQPSARYTLKSRGGKPFYLDRGIVPVELSGSLSYNSFITGKPVVAPQRYVGVYSFGGFDLQPGMTRLADGGLIAYAPTLRRPSDVLALTRGTGRGRETFVSRVFSRDFTAAETGTYDVTAGFRSTSYRGSRNPLITGTTEGGIRLVGIEKTSTIVEPTRLRIGVLEEYRTSAFRLGETNYFVRPAKSVPLTKPSRIKNAVGVAFPEYNTALVFPGRSAKATKASKGGLFSIEQVGQHELGHLAFYRAEIEPELFGRRLENLGEAGVKEINALRKVRALKSEKYYLEEYGDRESVIKEYFADLYSFAKREPTRFGKLAPKVAEVMAIFDKPISITAEAARFSDVTAPRVGLGLTTQAYRTRAESLLFTPGQGVKILRPEENAPGFGLLERFGLYRRAPRPIEAYNEAMFADTGRLYANIPLLETRPRTVTSPIFDEPASVLRPQLEPPTVRGLPLPAIAGLTPRVSMRALRFPSVVRNPATLNRQVTATLPRLSPVEITSAVPRLRPAVLTRNALEQARVPVSTTRLYLETRPVTDTVPRLSLFPLIGIPPTLTPPPTPFIPFPPMFLNGGGFGGMGKTHRRYGLSRTVFEVETGRAGRNLLRAPRGGFTGAELARSFNPRRRKRR